jgi:CubicO group peptidase (beta-lactamase class C family)
MSRLGPDAVFDLASLTKPLASGLLALYLVGKGRLDIGTPLSKTIPELNDSRFDAITVDMLLDHTSGWPPHAPYWDEANPDALPGILKPGIAGTDEALPIMKDALVKTAFEQAPGTKAVYSDLGFMALGWILEGIVGRPMDVFLEKEIYGPLNLKDSLFFIRLGDPKLQRKHARTAFVATEDCPWREKLIQGEVHDPKAWAMGGVAGHAGLFGTVDGVWHLCRILLDSHHGDHHFFHSATLRRFWTRSKRPRDTTRTLVWDTPNAQNSSAGKRFSRNSVGHLGFTGTSVWIDLSTGVIGVVLANAAHPSPEGKADAMRAFRARMYDHIAKAGDALPPDGGQSAELPGEKVGPRGAGAFGSR